MTKPRRILLCRGLLPLLRPKGRLKNLSCRVLQLVAVSSCSFAGAFLFLAFSICLCPTGAIGQDIVESAGSTSASAVGGSAAKLATLPSLKTPEDNSKSRHLLVTTVQHPEVANRQALEQKSGKNPGKLLLRSTPSGTQVFVNGMFVGSTPLLLVVAPGKYQVELRRARMKPAATSVDLLPSETRTVSLTLSARYPTRVSVR